MKTTHQTIFSDSSAMAALSDNSVDLVVTSPPYPMIEMWDAMFCRQDRRIRKRLNTGDGSGAFEMMHRRLDRVWKEVFRVLKPGGFACINIGDATRTVNGHFALYPNHARILQAALALGFSSLPCILWRKQTNAPNKFMGSGMLPAGAYVTLEHEYVLILRKGGRRVFSSEAEKVMRRESALFWEERNLWFSDIWLDIKGTVQSLKGNEARKRSGAYPFELAHRLIRMYSMKGDLVLDPFLGTGTTSLAAMAAARNSIGYEIDESFGPAWDRVSDGFLENVRDLIRDRLFRHIEFVRLRIGEKGDKAFKHTNIHYGFPVITAQEKELLISDPVEMARDGDQVTVSYASSPQSECCINAAEDVVQAPVYDKLTGERTRQLTLF